jgi:hypothetical protein
MVTCPRCGATIDPSAAVCPYCQTQTHYGRAQAAQHAAYQQQAAEASAAQLATQRQARLQAISTKAKHALYWSLCGAVLCCFPAAIIGVVMGLHAKSLAKRDGAVAPGTSTAAIVLGASGLLLFALGVVFYVRESQAMDARIALLEAQTEPRRADESLDQRLACGIVELELLREGHAGKSGINIEGFQCDGRLDQSAASATLHDVRFRTGTDAKHVVAACLTRGARWSVKELRDDGSCAPRPSAASASATSSAR